MSGPSDKHMQTARKAVSDYFGGSAYDGSALVTDIATALATAEQEGMRRAAAIIQEGFDKAVGTSFRTDGKPSKNDQCLHGFFMYEDCEACCVAAILSQANSNSPGTLPVEADSAGEATSSSRASPAVPFPWQGRGFNPDSVG